MRLWVAILATIIVTSPVHGDTDFARDVLPVLSENCFFCHGPDPNTRQSGLRLDTAEGAFKPRRGRITISPGKADESELIRRIFSSDPDEQMPPPTSNRKLSAAQKAALRSWVNNGAKWGQHWAFTPLPETVSVPAVAGVRSPIDAFIRHRLQREKVQPSPPATKEAWLRRVSLDLTGLPPTLAEIDNFIADQSPSAHERVVDRLLASPRYAERMATDWLDLARYADTHGYQMDRARPMWPYRDWVLRAFERNQRFDEFLTWQLAGDLLPNASKEQKLATAFNRLHMQNEEGGVVGEEFRVAYVVDRVTTTGTAFLGLTLECCRCHDHKYDPLTIREFYSLFAFFQNIDEAGQTTYFTSSMPVPTLLLSTDEQDKTLAKLESEIRTAEKALNHAKEQARQEFSAWLKQRSPARPHPRGLVAAYSFEDWSGGKVANAVQPASPGQPHDGPTPISGRTGGGAGLSGENGFVFPGVGHFSRSDPFTLALWLKPSEHDERAVVVHHSKAPVDAGSRGYELLLENGQVAFGLHHMWPGNALKVRTKTKVPLKRWSHVTATYDGSSRAAGVRIAIDGRPVELEVIRDGLWKEITYEGGEPNLAIGHRFRDRGFRGGAIDEFRVYNRAISEIEARELAGDTSLFALGKPNPDSLSANDREKLFEYFLAHHHTATEEATETLHKARSQQSQFINPIAEAMVMKELRSPKPAFVLKRGAYDAPGDPVTPDTPASLPPFADDLPRNRLGLARWLTQPNHPLTARVTVNRLWQQMFGMGLVETSDNFGTTGTPPTHPELLDWLARDFIASGWDVKRFLKQIALSDTYRQSSKHRPELEQVDPYNQLLARAPSRRLTAEMLRDQALFVSGLLVEKRGGSSVYPYQPEGLWNEAMGRPKYPQSKGDDLYRRSLYTYWKRTAPHPQLTTFDAADRSVCTARRQSTSTPLQALALLNDPQLVEAGRLLGVRMLEEGGTTPADRVQWAFRTVTGRAATPAETAILVRLYNEQHRAFAADPASTKALLTIGERPAHDKLDPIDQAAATQLGLSILNHDAAVMRR